MDAHSTNGRDLKGPTDVDQRHNLEIFLPATSRDADDHVAIPTSYDEDFLERELSVRRLNEMHGHLWLCGRPNPPRPLHRQLLLGRDIQITEDADLHLVWMPKRIFIKPLPRWLIETGFGTARQLLPTYTSPRLGELGYCARGFLFTYTALISYESDFNIAHDKGLLPGKMTWDEWRMLSAQIVQEHSYRDINQRYWYGELRLSRLNKVYRVYKGNLLRGYSSIGSYVTYDDLLIDNFAGLAAALAYVVVVLTAMQVGLSTEQLSGGLFQDVSYGFTVFSIIAPLAACAAIFVMLVAVVINNWFVTMRQGNARLGRMGVLT